jgi:hypothetical protein
MSIASRVRRKAASWRSSEPWTATGSSKGHCRTCSAPGKICGQDSAALAHTTIAVLTHTSEHLPNVLRSEPRRVYTDLLQDPLRHRVHTGRLHAGAPGAEAVPGMLAKQGLSDLAPRRVVRADEEDAWLVGHGPQRNAVGHVASTIFSWWFSGDLPRLTFHSIARRDDRRPIHERAEFERETCSRSRFRSPARCGDRRWLAPRSSDRSTKLGIDERAHEAKCRLSDGRNGSRRQRSTSCARAAEATTGV